jgi:hypothetical protein
MSSLETVYRVSTGLPLDLVWLVFTAAMGLVFVLWGAMALRSQKEQHGRNRGRHRGAVGLAVGAVLVSFSAWLAFGLVRDSVLLSLILQGGLANVIEGPVEY